MGGAARWTAAVTMAQGVYALEQRRAAAGAAGARAAGHGGRPPAAPRGSARSRARRCAKRSQTKWPGIVDRRLAATEAGFVLWETDGASVSLAGYGGETPNGVRIGPVYTPPEHRDRGYGTAVTAAVSAERLAAGRRFCFLYTDLSNPTSNSIYVKIGYRRVCDSLEVDFRPPRGQPLAEDDGDRVHGLRDVVDRGAPVPNTQPVRISSSAP